MQRDHLPEDLGVAEGAEPEEVDPGGEDGGAAEEEAEKDEGEEDEEAASPVGGLVFFRVIR